MRGWQLVVKDPTALSGEALAAIVRLLAEVTGSQFVTCRDVDGAGEAMPALTRAVLVASVRELLKCAPGIVQLDWGEFFLCRSEAIAQSISAEEPRMLAMGKADVTLRCVDSSYFY